MELNDAVLQTRRALEALAQRWPGQPMAQAPPSNHRSEKPQYDNSRLGFPRRSCHLEWRAGAVRRRISSTLVLFHAWYGHSCR